MNRTVVVAMLMLWGAPALAENPLARANFQRHLSGPQLEVSAFEGKVVLLEYFGFR